MKPIDPLASQVLLNASKRYSDAVRRANKRKPKAKVRQVVTKPHNRLYEFKEMRLFICESVRKRLYELDERDYQRKHGQ